MPTRRIVVLGAGGFAREVRWLCESIRDTSGNPCYQFVGYVISDLSKVGPNDSRDELLGDYTWLTRHRDDFDALTLSMGTPKHRLSVAEALEPTFGPEWWPSLVHPSVQMDRSSCSLAHGAQVCAGAVLTVNVVIEPHAVVNFGATVGHESKIGRACVVNPGANVSGGVTIGMGTLVGTGAQIRQYIDIGIGATVGAGAVVVKPVKPGETVVGVPARPMRLKGDA
jgi:sugar O-acyltransferase (sialic acid O-acetyltransferase NeuD family)